MKSNKGLLPEEVVKKFFSALKRRRFTEALHFSTFTYQSNHKVSEIFHNWNKKKITEIELIGSKQIASAITDIQVKISYTFGKTEFHQFILVRCVCERAAYQAYSDGVWGVNPISTLKEDYKPAVVNRVPNVNIIINEKVISKKKKGV